MGTRIHKVLGWGLTDLKKKDPRLTPKRLQIPSTPFKVFKDWMMVEENFTQVVSLVRAEYPFLNAKEAHEKCVIDRQMTSDNTLAYGHFPDIAKCLHFDDYEEGFTRKICIVPPNCLQWSRSDDSLDYYTAQGSRPTCKRLTVGIYPWAGFVIRVRPPATPLPRPLHPLFEDERPNRSDEHGPISLDPAEYSMLIGKWSRKTPPLASGALLEHLKNDFRGPLPFSLVAWVLWSGIASNPAEFLKDLRPMLYTYWC